MYWCNIGTAGLDSLDGSVMRVSKQGGEPEVLRDHLNRPRALQVRDGVLVWVTQGTERQRYLDGTVQAMAL